MWGVIEGIRTFEFIDSIIISSQVMYVTAILPYFSMFSLFIRGITLEGAWIGISEYLYIDFKVLTGAQVKNNNLDTSRSC